MICIYSDVMLYLPSRDLLCHMNLISQHTASLILFQTNIFLLLTCIVVQWWNILRWTICASLKCSFRISRDCLVSVISNLLIWHCALAYGIHSCIKWLRSWIGRIRATGNIQIECATRCELKQYKQTALSQFQCLIFHNFLPTRDVRILIVDWIQCYWWVSCLPLDTPNGCQDIYLQQATTASSHIHSKS